MVFKESDTDMLAAMPLPPPASSRTTSRPENARSSSPGTNLETTVFWGTLNSRKARRRSTSRRCRSGSTASRHSSSTTSATTTVSPSPGTDDPNNGFPAYEKTMELRIGLIGVHKGVPLGP